MAVPTGTYDVRASIDLSPWFGKIETEESLWLDSPGREALDDFVERIEKGRDAAAVYELAWFTKDADRVVPLLVRLLDDDDLRNVALSALRSFPDRIAAHVPRILRIVLRGDTSDRLQALSLLAEAAPDTPFVRRVLAAAAAEEEPIASAARSALARLDARK